MTVQVRCFAHLRDRIGQSAFALSLPAGATVSDALGALRARHPDAAPWLEVSRLAVNEEFASGEAVLRDGDEVAVIPPVSGG